LLNDKTAVGRTQPPIQWVMEAISSGIKWPGFEADRSLPCNVKVKNAMRGAIPPLTHTSSWGGA